MTQLLMPLRGFQCLLILFLSIACSASSAVAADMKLKAQLIWGTNDEKSPNPDHKPIDPALGKKLDKMPIKWKNYFQVTERELTVAQGATQKVEMSPDLAIAVKNVDGKTVEMKLLGKGKSVGKVTKELGKGKSLITGGDAANYTAWFVYLKQVE
jgi:hypothetical protein